VTLLCSRRFRPALAALLFSATPLRAGSRVQPVASYQIEASYTAAGHTLTGKETVRFTNRTSHALADLELHLYLNAWRNDRSTWLREEREGRGRPRRRNDAPEWFGYSEINRIELADGTDLTAGLRFLAPDDGNTDDRTLASAPLPRPLAPGESVVFRIDFAARFPRTIARTGWKDDFVMGAQWFPKLCAATDAGWSAHQFHAGTEFFADFGDYDVTLTLPKDMKGKVGATGVIKDEVELSGGLVRVRFLAEDVHDFAWTASPRYEVYRDTFTHEGLPNVEIILLLQPDHRRVKERYFRATKEALAHYGMWYLPYPYPAVTVVDPPWGSASGGMEYPTLFTGGVRWLAPPEAQSPEGVTIHEFGHQVFYGMIATNEFEEAHLDEGFNSYATDRTLKAAYGDPDFMVRFFGIPFVFRSVPITESGRVTRFADWQTKSRSDATSVPTFRDLDGPAILNNAYNKTATLLASCERTFGEKTWSAVMKTYAQRFAFRHPTSQDFLAVVKEIAGGEAEERVRESWGTSYTVDYAVTVAETRPAAPSAGWQGAGSERTFAATRKAAPEKTEAATSWESVVVIRRMGEATWPTEVEFRFAGSPPLRRTWDGKARWIRYRITGPKLLEAIADPDRKDLLDVNVLNNGRRTESDTAAASHWAGRLRFWAQNVLELFALLGFAGAVP